jgi:hypothetical protein
MSAQNSARINQFARWLIVLFVAFDVAFLWQKGAGAYESEFGAHPDEAAHYVTGLFVHDALATLPRCVGERSLQPLAPFRGKEAPDGFYQHYPKVSLGVWPPAFYLLQSAWTFPFGVSRTSILLLMATLAASVATLLYRAIRTEFGDWAAAAAAILWLCSPLVRESYGMVMAEMLSTLTMFGATLVWGRFLDEHRTRDAVWFGLLAAAAILTKGTGVALVLMCALSIAITRQWKLLAARATWLAIGLVIVIAGPWTWIFRAEGTRVGGWADNSGGLSAKFTWQAVGFYAEKLAFAAGLAIAVFAVIGFALRAFGGERRGRWAALGALVMGVFVFQCVLPVGLEERHIISATPALVMLAIAGVSAIGRLHALRVEGREQKRREMLWVVLLLLLTLPPIVGRVVMSGVEQKACGGFQRIAEELLGAQRDGTAPPGARILISSDARGEGMFISEIAMRDTRPNFFVERASISLVEEASRKWDGREQRDRFKDDQDLLEYLVSSKIDYIVLDAAVPEHKRATYHDQIQRVIGDNIGLFWFIQGGESPIARDGETRYPPARLYRIKRGHSPFPSP